MEQIGILHNYQKHEYNSLNYLDEEDIQDMIKFYESDICIILYRIEGNKMHVYWGTELCEELINHIELLSKKFINLSIYLEFIPESFVDAFHKLGFEVYSEYADFWNKDIMNFSSIQKPIDIIIRELEENEFEVASKITYSCKGQSRGFDGESVKDLMEWYEAEYSKVFVAIADDEIVGIMLTSLYGFDNKDKITLWIRLLAVDPKHQRKGVGQSLLSFGLDWGMKNNAKRSFLHADVHNDGAIDMYRRNGYNMNEGRGQINMLLGR